MSDPDEQDPLDWIRSHPERVEALAESDRRVADDARAVLDYLDSGETDGFEDILTSPRGSWSLLTRSDAQQRARNVRDALADGEDPVAETGDHGGGDR